MTAPRRIRRSNEEYHQRVPPVLRWNGDRTERRPASRPLLEIDPAFGPRCGPGGRSERAACDFRRLSLRDPGAPRLLSGAAGNPPVMSQPSLDALRHTAAHVLAY